jgi:hypothetical protein
MSADKLYVEFTLNNDDIIAMNHFLLQNTPEWKRVNKSKHNSYLYAVIFPIIGIISLLKGITTEFTPWGWVGVCFIIFGFIPLTSYLYANHYWNRNIKNQVNKLYGRGKDTLVGLHKYTISPEGVHDITEFDDTTYKWKAIENIVQTDKYIFITVPPRGVFIITKRAFPDDSAYNQFFEDAKTIFQTAQKTV